MHRDIELDDLYVTDMHLVLVEADAAPTTYLFDEAHTGRACRVYMLTALGLDVRTVVVDEPYPSTAGTAAFTAEARAQLVGHAVEAALREVYGVSAMLLSATDYHKRVDEYGSAAIGEPMVIDQALAMAVHEYVADLTDEDIDHGNDRRARELGAAAEAAEHEHELMALVAKVNDGARWAYVGGLDVHVERTEA